MFILKFEMGLFRGKTVHLRRNNHIWSNVPWIPATTSIPHSNCKQDLKI